MFQNLSQHKIPILFAIISIVFYLSFAYDLHRSDFTQLISLYTAIFIFAYLLIKNFRLSFWFLASLGIIFRLLFIPAIPNLSQDFYRFLWDGRLVAQGVSPYLFTPDLYFKEILASSEIVIPQARALYEGMGTLSAGHFSNYPPVNQFFFAIAALLAGQSILGSVVVLRVLIILADLGILYFGKKLLKKLNLPSNNIFWYFLNPFIIIELTGNLHFEGVMLFFFVWAIYLLLRGKWFWPAVLIGVSISVKLLPLLFLPLFINFFIRSKKISKDLKSYGMSVKRLFGFYLSIGASVILTFVPFFSFLSADKSSEFLQNFSATIALWFQNFEFNASVYYIIRWIGFQIVGWNTIETVGKILPILVLLFVFALAFFSLSAGKKGNNKSPQQLVSSMLWAVTFYFLLATTVHPWYIATPLLISVFTKYKFAVVWSFMVMFSYSAYGKDGFDEKLWLVALEYTIVLGVLLWELSASRKSLQAVNKNKNTF